ncbi:hypothetical protein Amsp01_074760 [Amycolatopsis sp. NBRC 101858]|uniref:suppressor of fused domain protein n=1 Tax=Amycolatopsis sp. NBRC 101858 TaxID=3032200 RepID=UPI0024A0CE23|nr:suppressor of fused domain protein [Amycolatopsis sp. NBRC 101858]GLY41453.1 hypothetical protein Amsp01_074760 [Amycolatopsis sp. NBRC 101858]
MGLIEHLEARLGALTGGWKRDGFQVGAYAGAFGAKWFATAGLSRHPLHSRTSGRHLRQELIVGSYPSGPTEGLPHLLGQVAGELLASGQALLRGDVLGPRGPFAPGSAMEALYASSPSYFDDEFAVAEVDDGARAAIVWLVPISAVRSGVRRFARLERVRRRTGPARPGSAGRGPRRTPGVLTRQRPYSMAVASVPYSTAVGASAYSTIEAADAAGARPTTTAAATKIPASKRFIMVPPRLGEPPR